VESKYIVIRKESGGQTDRPGV